MSQTDSTAQTEETASPSRKQELTATVASAAVTVVLSIAANVLIGKVSNKVQNQIAPKPE